MVLTNQQFGEMFGYDENEDGDFPVALQNAVNNAGAALASSHERRWPNRRHLVSDPVLILEEHERRRVSMQARHCAPERPSREELEMEHAPMQANQLASDNVRQTKVLF